jgi:manganese/zinc/iron transport system substrate-binding protein
MVRTTLLLCFVVLLAGCGSAAGSQEGDGKLNVVATTGQLADMVRNLGGEAITVNELLGPGIDPHTYVATESDIRLFQNADLIFYNGLNLEAQLERVLEQIGERDQTIVVAVGNQLEESQLLSWEPENGFPHDPHIWNDVQLWKQVTELVRDTLIEADSTNSATYSANATRYLGELDELHNYMLTQIERVPAERRVLVTAHDAFNYLGRAYGLEVAAVQGISTEAEASAADIQALVDVIVERQVPAIFVESTISPRTIEAVLAAAQSAGQEVRLGGELYSDALGAPDSPAGTYIGMMRSNIDTIVAALA